MKLFHFLHFILYHEGRAGLDARGARKREEGGFGSTGRYPKFMREETYWISRQGGAKLRGSAGCLTETEKFQRDGCAQE